MFASRLAYAVKSNAKIEAKRTIAAKECIMRPIFILIVFLVCLSLHAQEGTSQTDVSLSTEPLNVRVLYESAFVRALPSEDSEAVSSVFENDVLEAIGRNADGTWIQVRRPFRDISLGWVARRLLVHSFGLSELPITDLTTGLIGTEPVFDTGFSVYILTEANLRDAPFIDANVVAIVPVMLTLPVLERNTDSRWFKINYLGIVGWINSFNISSTNDLTQVPLSPDFIPDRPDLIVIEIIPPEVQLAQAYRMRDFVQPRYDTASELAAFWGGLLDGLTLPCNPPEQTYGSIEITQRDLYELPELRRASRFLPRALEDLNASIAMMQQCRAFNVNETTSAYADAINARGIFGGILGQMQTVEAMLLPQIGGGD
jgi:hypothetical protein